MKPDVTCSLVAAILALGLCASEAAAQMADRLGPGPIVTQGGDAEIETHAILLFSVPGSVELNQLTLSEVLGTASSTVNRGAWFPGADPTGGVTVNPAVPRIIDPVWSAWFTQQGNNTNNIDVQLSISGLDGSAGYLTHQSISSSRIAVTLIPTALTLVLKIGNLRQIQGGAQLWLDCSQATRAGHYGGRITVTVNQL